MRTLSLAMIAVLGGLASSAAAANMYSLGGYAPAADCGCAGGNNGAVDSPTGGCGIWNGYQARPCGHHRHFAGVLGSGCGCGGGGGYGAGFGGGGFIGGGPAVVGALGCGCGCASPCDTCGTGGGGCGGGCHLKRHCLGQGWGGGAGWGGSWVGGGPAVVGALGCGCGCPSPCSTGCNPCGRHHCKLFGHHHRGGSCGAPVDCGCGSNAGGTIQDDSANYGTPDPNEVGPSLTPTPAPEPVKAAPEAPGPSARTLRRFLPTL